MNKKDIAFKLLVKTLYKPKKNDEERVQYWFPTCSTNVNYSRTADIISKYSDSADFYRVDENIKNLDTVTFGRTNLVFEPVINPSAVCLQTGLHYLDRTNTRGHESDHTPMIYRCNPIPEVKVFVATDYFWVQGKTTGSMPSEIQYWFGEQLKAAYTEARLTLVTLLAKRALLEYARQDVGLLRKKLEQVEQNINPRIEEYDNGITSLINCG